MLTDVFHTFPLKRACLTVATTLLLLSCAAPLPPANPERAARLRNEGLNFALKRDFASAIKPYYDATRYEPGNSTAYLKLAEFQIATEQPQAAYDTYDRALKYLPATNPKRELIHYKSGLLMAEKLDRAGRAQNHLDELSNVVLKSDLAGTIALNRGKPRQALKHFQTALKYKMESDLQARVYFHIAKAYDLLGEDEKSSKALLIAIPKATSRDLKEDIRRYFESVLSR